MTLENQAFRIIRNLDDLNKSSEEDIVEINGNLGKLISIINVNDEVSIEERPLNEIIFLRDDYDEIRVEGYDVNQARVIFKDTIIKYLRGSKEYNEKIKMLPELVRESATSRKIKLNAILLR